MLTIVFCYCVYFFLTTPIALLFHLRVCLFVILYGATELR